MHPIARGVGHNRAMSLRRIDANLLVALQALLRERNVTRAARSVGLSQSAMSHALARLRAQLGDELLVSGGRELALTPRARALAPDVERAALCLERVFAPAPAFDPATSDRTFQIAGTDNLGLYVLPALLARLATEAPSASVRFHALTKDWAALLRRGQLDLKLGRKYAIADDLRADDLVTERFVCVVRRGHPALARTLTVEDYARLRHVVVTPTHAVGDPVGSVVDDALARRGLRRHVAATVPSFLLAPFVVASSDLALTTSARLLGKAATKLALREVELPMKLRPYTLSQVWAARMDGDDGLAWLRRAIAELVA